MAKKYSETFKAHAVQKVREGATCVRVAKEIGTSVHSVRQWLKDADRNEGERVPTREELLEIKRLRRENWELREERAVLMMRA